LLPSQGDEQFQLAQAANRCAIPEPEPQEGCHCMSELIPPWDRVKRNRSLIQERGFAKRTGARPQVNSGRIWSSLRDATLNSFLGRLLVDNKTTEAGSYTIKKDDWELLKRDANRTPPGCHPALQIDIGDLHLFVLGLSTWDEAMEYIMFLEGQVEKFKEGGREGGANAVE
jgi:hypothetical protein